MRDRGYRAPRPGEMSEGRLGQGQPELLARGHNQDDSVAAQGPLGERVETRTPGKTQASPGIGYLKLL